VIVLLHLADLVGLVVLLVNVLTQDMMVHKYGMGCSGAIAMLYSVHLVLLVILLVPVMILVMSHLLLSGIPTILGDYAQLQVAVLVLLGLPFVYVLNKDMAVLHHGRRIVGLIVLLFLVLLGLVVILPAIAPTSVM